MPKTSRYKTLLVPLLFLFLAPPLDATTQEKHITSFTPKYPLAFYRDWTYQILQEFSETRYGVELPPLDPKVKLPRVFEAPQEYIDSSIPKRGHKKGYQAFFADDEIYISRTRILDSERLIVHEFVHYLIEHYAKHFSVVPQVEENTADEIDRIFWRWYRQECHRDTTGRSRAEKQKAPGHPEAFLFS